MAVAVLIGHGDADVLKLLPATVTPDRVALVGLHAWAEDDIGNVADWGIRSFNPDDVRATTQPLLDWLAATGCSRVAIHFDVDTIDSNEIVLGLGAEPDGLTSARVRRIVEDINAVSDVVGLTNYRRVHPTAGHASAAVGGRLSIVAPVTRSHGGHPFTLVNVPAERISPLQRPDGIGDRQRHDQQYGHDQQ
jgi:Arginase family